MRGETLNIPRYKRFFCVNGREAETLFDLRNILLDMSDSDFHHHTNGRNDFSNWIRDILHKDELAEKLRQKQEKKDVLSLIEEEMEREKSEYPPVNFRRLFIKDFVYGLLFGLIIGILLDLLV